MGSQKPDREGQSSLPRDAQRPRNDTLKKCHAHLVGPARRRDPVERGEVLPGIIAAQHGQPVGIEQKEDRVPVIVAARIGDGPQRVGVIAAS